VRFPLGKVTGTRDGSPPRRADRPDRNSTEFLRLRCRDQGCRAHLCMPMVRSSAPGSSARRRLVRLTIAGLFALSTACSGGGHKADPTTTSPSSASTSTTLSGSAQVEAGYRAFWDAYLAAADPMNPTNPVLAAHATGDELHQVQTAFADHFGKGEVIRGRLDLAPKVASVSATTATVADCYGDSTHVFDASTGQQKDPQGDTRFQITATLILDGDTWKVSAIKKEGQPCTPA
jgi:hypothetical protein